MFPSFFIVCRYTKYCLSCKITNEFENRKVFFAHPATLFSSRFPSCCVLVQKEKRARTEREREREREERFGAVFHLVACRIHIDVLSLIRVHRSLVVGSKPLAPFVLLYRVHAKRAKRISKETKRRGLEGNEREKNNGWRRARSCR